MDQENEGKGAGGQSNSQSSGQSPSEQSIIDQIKAICRNNARSELDSEERLILFLKSWWSKTYNRPLKDPLLLSYTLEELLYEFYDRIERTQAEIDRVNEEADKIELNKEQKALDWAEQEELKELAEEAAKAAASQKDPSKDQANVDWMNSQLEKAKQQYGESFGEDINDSFDGS